MSFALVRTRGILGVNARPITVEVHLSNGLPSFTLVGLPETAVKESKDRVRSAILNSHYEFPCRRITVNLAPADAPKTGSGFDLPIAIGILAAAGHIPLTLLANHEFIGELALNGELRGIPAIIPVVLAAQHDEYHLIIAGANAKEASLVHYRRVLTADSLVQVCNYLNQTAELHPLPSCPNAKRLDGEMDWSDIKGQYHAKRGLTIAAAGGHNVLLSGPPGSGKTLLAKRFTTLLPELTPSHALENVAIHSIRGNKLNFEHWREPTLRAPHHTASPAALVGGGNPPKPGEISLAHNGVLFLDELTEFNRHVLETLREPLESGSICISRAGTQTEFPARFQLIAAMNPCPCGQWGNSRASCLCTPDQINRYLAKLSAPFLERIDIQLSVQGLTNEELLTPNGASNGESIKIRTLVAETRARQIARQGCINAYLNARDCESLCELGSAERAFLSEILSKLKLSTRGFHRLLKVSRTIADMENQDKVTVAELQQALSFRQLVKNNRL